ncbi:ATP-grasp peptide maturase system methyltransferase [Micromonospora sp. HM5-17]|uniref:ATP-grasp peptide maturase system methyltransferase n=1 Tax=Micromonospora sp. HM5-17 TaxID=2487710 RepID=UPI000F4AA54D|nr:ATP-grasp peptide maturase system methyltransferase [Micromonospora sp. HM5-17]ROT32391.1 methyltransferase domain-containing protein [Micromonospora sp. HM5-17]
MTEQRAEDIARFLAGLEADGYLSDPAWKQAFGAVPRHVFLPAFFLPLPDGRWQAIDASHPDYWANVYADTTLTTQLDGTVSPDPDSGPLSGTGTCSSTQPGLMALMLDALCLSGGERVLEIGTGTGYNAALLAHRLGSANVASVEVDPVVADLARQRLAVCGYRPTVITGDGEQGWPEGGPYDRIIATVSVPAVPPAWLAQVRDGGAIVVSLWRDLGGGPLVRLEVNAGSGQGFFLAEAGGFMPVRAVNRAAAALPTAVKQTGTTRPTRHPSHVLHHPDAGLWLALRVTGVTWLGFTPDGGNEQMWLFASDGSWAAVDDTAGQVEQYGPREVWDEIETVFDRWCDAGSPTRDRLGLTVTDTGAHRFWLDSPNAVVWDDAGARR